MACIPGCHKGHLLPGDPHGSAGAGPGTSPGTGWDEAGPGRGTAGGPGLVRLVAELGTAAGSWRAALLRCRWGPGRGQSAGIPRGLGWDSKAWWCLQSLTENWEAL